MTRKDYDLIAQEIRKCLPEDRLPRDGKRRLVSSLAHKLKADNPRFDAARFTAACAEQA
jgi:hypothetical protein